MYYTKDKPVSLSKSFSKNTLFEVKSYCKPYLNGKEQIQLYEELCVPITGMKNKDNVVLKTSYCESKLTDKNRVTSKNNYKDKLTDKDDYKDNLNLEKFNTYKTLGLDNIKGLYDLNYLPYLEEHKDKYLQEESNVIHLRKIFPTCQLLKIENVKSVEVEFVSNVCCVCLEEKENYINCGHNACYSCIEKLVKIKCPLCQVRITSVSGKIRRTVIKEKSTTYKETPQPVAYYPILMLTPSYERGISYLC
jgi:hypothetical protein